jgi:Glycosyltransferase family 9 (heptosyltransferase)
MHRTAILNGFGRSLGDSIIGLQALHIALRSGALAPDPTLFRLPGFPRIIEDVYSAAADFVSVSELSWKYEQPASLPFLPFSKLIDLRDFAFDPRFREVHMIDYFLEKLGVAPAAIKPGDKRLSWLQERIPRRSVGAGYVLVCPFASVGLRQLPKVIHDTILDWCDRNVARPVLTQARLSPASTLAELTELVAEAAIVVSTDTSMVHLSDAYSVPCLAFFTTHPPEMRSRYYPHCHAFRLKPALPEALEFPRSAKDYHNALSAWFPDGSNLDWLIDLLASTVIPILQHTPCR